MAKDYRADFPICHPHSGSNSARLLNNISKMATLPSNPKTLSVFHLSCSNSFKSRLNYNNWPKNSQRNLSRRIKNLQTTLAERKTHSPLHLPFQAPMPNNRMPRSRTKSKKMHRTSLVTRSRRCPPLAKRYRKRPSIETIRRMAIIHHSRIAVSWIPNA